MNTVAKLVEMEGTRLTMAEAAVLRPAVREPRIEAITITRTVAFRQYACGPLPGQGKGPQPGGCRRSRGARG